MSRRSRTPGPINQGPNRPRGRLYVPALQPWTCVNPCPDGVMPADVGGLASNDIDNGVPGVWYYYDPNTTLDISGSASTWVGQLSTGVEFIADLSKTDDSGNKMQYLHNQSQGGRVATAFMKPDGSGQFTFGDLHGVSIEFLGLPGEVSPHDENDHVGIYIGLAKNTVMSATSGGSTYGLGIHYDDADAGTSAIGSVITTPGSSSTKDGASGITKYYADFEFMNRTDTQMYVGYTTGWGVDSDGETNSIRNSVIQSGTFPAPGDKVYLVVGVYALDADGAGSGIKRTGGFKLWYRLRWHPLNISPNWVPGGNNNPYSGLSSGYFGV